MIMAMGLVDLTLALNHKMMLINAARAGMQYGIVHKPVDGNHSEILAAVTLALPSDSNATVTSAMYCTCLDSGSGNACVNTDTNTETTCSDGSNRASYLKITITTSYDTLLQYPGVLSDGKINFSEELDIRLNGGVTP